MKKIFFLILLLTACAPVTATQGDSVTIITGPLTFNADGAVLGEAFKYCGPDKKPVRTAYSPAIWFIGESTYICQPKTNK